MTSKSLLSPTGGGRIVSALSPPPPSHYVAPLMDGCGGVRVGRPIHEVQATALRQMQDLALVVVLDPDDQSILLRLANDLQWRYHFGCHFVLPQQKNQQQQQDTAIREEQQDYIGNVLQSQAGVSLCTKNNENFVFKTGTMLFSFASATALSSQREDAVVAQPPPPPMRVTVFQALVRREDNEETAGEWIDWKECPYHEMWADDIVWLPKLLRPMSLQERRGIHFEGHFCFDDKGPGPTARLLRHNCQFSAAKEV